MEYNPFSGPEDDDSEEDEESTDKKKKTTKIPRHVPGISVDRGKEESEDKKEQKVARILDSLFKGKDDKAPEKVEEAEENKTAEEDDAPERAEFDLVAPVEARRDEGDLGEDEEISFSRPLKADVVEAEAVESADNNAIETVPTETEENAPTPDSVETESGAVDGGNGEEPPNDTTEEELSEFEPYDAASYGSEPLAARETTRFTSPEVTLKAKEEELNDAEYYGEKRGQRRGVLTGLVFGWMFGRRGKRKMEKGYEKDLKSRDTEIKKLSDEQIVAQERLKALQRNQEKIESVIANKALERPKESPVALEDHRADREPLIASILSSKKAEKAPVTKEVAPEDREITEEMYQALKGRRVEASSWHRIEMDAKTGRPVNSPEVEYGEAFRHETGKEILRDNAYEDKGLLSVDSGGVGLARSSVNTESSSVGNTSVPSSGDLYVPRQGEPFIRGVGSYARNPFIWAIAIIVVVVLFIFGFLR